MSECNQSPAVSTAIIDDLHLSPPGPGDSYDVLISRDLTLGSAEHWLLSTENLLCVAAPARCREFAAQPMVRWQFLAAQSRLEDVLI